MGKYIIKGHPKSQTLRDSSVVTLPQNDDIVSS